MDVWCDADKSGPQTTARRPKTIPVTHAFVNNYTVFFSYLLFHSLHSFVISDAMSAKIYMNVFRIPMSDIFFFWFGQIGCASTAYNSFLHLQTWHTQLAICVYKRARACVCVGSVSCVFVAIRRSVSYVAAAADVVDDDYDDDALHGVEGPSEWWQVDGVNVLCVCVLQCTTIIQNHDWAVGDRCI